MKLLMIAVIVLVPVLSITGVFTTNPASNAQIPNDPTTLEARIKPAKERGLKKVVFPTPQSRPAALAGLEDALTRFAVVIAEPIEKITLRLDPWSIHSFYRLKILERLNDAPAWDCCVSKDMSDQLPALDEGELYLQVYGGTVMIEGIEVTIREKFRPVLHEKHLLFLSQNPSKKMALVSLGPRGVFFIREDGKPRSIVKEPNPLKQDIEQKYGNSIHRLKEALAQRQSLDKK